jgi:hypothetical protein
MKCNYDKNRIHKIIRRNRKRKIAVAKRKRITSKITPNERKVNSELRTTFKGYSRVPAPRVFSLVENTVDTIGFIDELELNIQNRKNTLVRLNNIHSLDTGAVIVLLSVMLRFKYENINFNGDFPRDRTVKRKLKDSGFLNRLYSKNKVSTIIGPRENIFTTFSNEVDSPLIGHVIASATTTVYGKSMIAKGVYRALVELMHNTHNHANQTSMGGANWYLSLDHDYKRKVVSFSFIDYGVGVFKSLNLKGESSKWYDWVNKMKSKHSYKNNAELLELILNGELHATVTGQHFRGKGLPGIYEASKRNQISNLHIITNDVHVDSTSGKFEILPVSFSGTYFYFELRDC